MCSDKIIKNYPGKEKRRGRATPENTKKKWKAGRKGDMDLLRSRLLPVIALIASLLFLYFRTPSSKVPSPFSSLLL
jgi:hypothetical protein